MRIKTELEKFELWHSLATPEQIAAAKAKAFEVGNEQTRAVLSNADPVTLKAVLKETWIKLKTEKPNPSIRTDAERRLHLDAVRADPTGWTNHGEYETKWDNVTRTVLRRRKDLKLGEKPQSKPWYTQPDEL